MIFALSSEVVEIPSPEADADLGAVCRPTASPPVEPYPFPTEPRGDVCNPVADSLPATELLALLGEVCNLSAEPIPAPDAFAVLGAVCSSDAVDEPSLEAEALLGAVCNPSA